MLQDHYNQNNPLFKGVIVKSFQEIQDKDGKSYYEAEIEMPVTAHHCPHCDEITTYVKDYRIQRAKDLNLLEKPLYLIIRKRRYVCPSCGSTFTESNPLIKRYQHFSSRFYLNAIRECFQLQPFITIANRIGVSSTSVARWFDNIAHPHPMLPEYFSIDEFKGNAGGEKFQCNISDPVRHKILDILPSRDTTKLSEHFLQQYAKEERDKVKGIVMDLSKIFRSIAHTLFPNAIIIADRFHVIRVVTRSLENVRKRIQKQFRKERRRWFKRSRKILLKREIFLSEEDRAILNRMLNASPELEKAYILKERFYSIFKEFTKQAAKKALQEWLLLVTELNVSEFKHCIDTFTQWSDAITNIVEHKISNGFIEGSNNKIKVLKRVSYGVKNFERFRNRILYLCS